MKDERPNRTWSWPPLVPRPVLVLAWVIFNGIAGLSIVKHLIQAAPGTPVWDTVWEAIGGDASGISYWALLGSYLYSEVVTMILTKWSNQARVEEAERRGRTEGIVEGEANRDRQWREYLSRREAAERAGLPFNEPPPEPPADGRNGS